MSSLVVGLFDLAKGTKVLPYYRFLKSTLNWSPLQVEQYQVERLKELLGYAIEHSAYYREVMKSAGVIPADIKSLADISSLPYLTRDILQQHTADILSSQKQKKIFASSSSGTTGIPIKYFHDVFAESAGVASGYYWWYLSGVKQGQRGVTIWGNPDSMKAWNTIGSKLKRFIFSQHYMPSTLFNTEANIPDLYKTIKNFKPVFINGYTNSIFELAGYIEKMKLAPLQLQAVFVTAENLMDYQRVIIEKHLGPVVDSYGCGEVNGIATQIKGDSRYFVIEPRVYVETISNAGMEEIVVTDLDNFYMPFIRYRPGDFIDAIHHAEAGAPCPYRYFLKVNGRTRDIINLGDGRIIQPINMFGGTFIREFEEVKKHKVVWLPKQNRIDFILEVTGNVQQHAIEQKIKNLLADYPVSFAVKYTSKILPDKNGKFKYFEVQS